MKHTGFIGMIVGLTFLALAVMLAFELVETAHMAALDHDAQRTLADGPCTETCTRPNPRCRTLSGVEWQICMGVGPK